MAQIQGGHCPWSKIQGGQPTTLTPPCRAPVNKQLPQYFNSFTCEANSDIHGYNTRSRNKLHIPKTNHNFAKNNLRYRIIQTLNKLPDNVIRKMYTHSIYGLTSYAKKYFISNYKTECTIENCYICQCSMR